MSSASVRSFEAIQRMREELQKFAFRSGEGLEQLEGEVRRVIDWVEHDRPGYWKERARRAFDAEAEAKNDLHRCLMFPINDEQPACAEQRAALRKAQAYRAHCEQMRVRVRELAHTLRHELQEYQGRVSQLKQAIEVDTPRSTALLARSLDALERYAQGASPGAPPAGGGESAPPPADQPEGDAG